MSDNTFDKGVVFGGLRSMSEIRLLICYLLKSIDAPISKSLLIDTVQQTALANYFEFNQALSELLENNHIACEIVEGEEMYCASESGKSLSESLQTDLTWTVRDKAVKAALRLMTDNRRKKENNVEITKTENGYKISLTIYASNNSTDENNKLLSLSLYTGDYLQAESIKQGFIADPTRFCEAIMSNLI